jgi:hypothetical protein
MIERLKALQSKRYSGTADLNEALKSDSGLRNEISALSRHFLGRSVSGCSNCFFDAYMELFYLKGMEEKTKFKIKRGVVLYDPINQDAGKLLTAANCTDELALYHLKFNPNCRRFFYELPDNVDALIEGYITGTPTTKTSGTKKEIAPEEPEGVKSSPHGAGTKRRYGKTKKTKAK